MNKQAKSARPMAKATRPLPGEKISLSAEAARRATDAFPIVGIGASAGGLEALEMFLANVPADSGMAFVIIQHLDPTHKGIMVELLQCGTWAGHRCDDRGSRWDLSIMAEIRGASQQESATIQPPTF